MKVSNLISKKEKFRSIKDWTEGIKAPYFTSLIWQIGLRSQKYAFKWEIQWGKLMWTGTVKKPLWDSSIIIQFPQHNYSGTTSAYNERQYFSYLSLLYMSETITDPLKEPCWVHTDWFVLQSMVTCFWDYNWESLIPSPTQRTGVKETPGTMSPLLSELSPYAQGHNSFSPHKFLAFVITHYTG